MADEKTQPTITLFLCGDVMTGRGIDQILPHPNAPVIYESYMKDARGYIWIAEMANGPIPKPVGFDYVWGDALQELDRVAPDLRIINLETSLTSLPDYWKGKGINYRMHPKNANVLTAAGIDFCALANNHVLDWGYSGLAETLETLKKLDIKSAGAGRNRKEASAPAVFEVEGGHRVIIFSFGLRSSGIPHAWAAGEDTPGVNLLNNLSRETVHGIKSAVQRIKRQGDIVIASIHWGGNWGYDIPDEQQVFAHRLINDAGIHVVHGHSSHHAKGIEIYREKLILYGSGDFLNDYEGIGGEELYRPDLALMYFVRLAPLTGKLIGLKLTPARIKNFKVNSVSRPDALWLRDMLNREGDSLGTRVVINKDNTLAVERK